ncbi:baseplate hub protein [Aeromonas phage SW69-9]|uniref:Baseplate hub distal subunit n=2 Tax=Biquartavirus 44RR2 TaxID=115987 RepID=Q6U9C0_9CAUD|nr:baseplate hub distal subunit [Aeromonas phage 44RR2.8t]AAQ81500.1 baseplate hub distal subunit [Aeromonas phage 44RR2.8t]APU00654.1 baseplate hub protein [Aeromonas phage 44RR2.8t.2]APU02482.1 baseplate hub protein [Aeromonas phage SW69-9]
MKPRLNIIPAVKIINVNGKEIKIPKLGFRQMKLMKDMQGVDDCMVGLLDSIRPGLTAAEADMVILHLLAFNKRIQTVQLVGGVEIDIDKAYMCAVYDFDFDGKTIHFKAPAVTDRFVSKIDILEKQFDRDKTGFDFDFREAPAFVLDWADEIIATIALDTPVGTIYGGSSIVGTI